MTRSRTKEERSLRANFVEGESYDMVVSSFDPTKYTLGLAAYDECNRDDPLEAPEYVTDIFQRLFRAEVRSLRYQRRHSRTKKILTHCMP